VTSLLEPPSVRHAGVHRRKSVVCRNCGHRNPSDAHFCANCGTLLQDDTTISFSPVEVEDEAAEEAALPRSELEEGQALLVVQRGPNAGSKFLIDKDLTTAGRHPESDIFLDDVTVSRRHAEFRRKDGRFQIHDVGSLNGTYVNRQRVETTELSNGDELQIGKFKLTFFTEG
jgi:pSer/pThr/pTyr-binding forkhead associated (FHA) protein/ribosomal protein L40E